MKRLSIIIPVYKAEAYLRRCLDSILKDAPVNDIEIIAVNDGSPDGSLDILREYENHYPCVHVIDKPNGGVSSARNAGLDAATGKYVMFVDADDAVDSEALWNLYDNVKDSGAQYVITPYTRVARNGEAFTASIPETSTADPRVMAERFAEIGPTVTDGPYAKFFRRDIIERNSLRFNTSMVIHEDGSFNFRFVAMATELTLLNRPFYQYITNDTNATARFQAEQYIHDAGEYCAIADAYYAGAFGSSDKVPKTISDARDRHLAFCWLFQIYTIYRAYNRPADKKRWHRQYLSAARHTVPDITSHWDAGLARLYARALRIHPLAGHYLLKAAFTVERLKKRLRHA